MAMHVSALMRKPILQLMAEIKREYGVSNETVVIAMEKACASAHIVGELRSQAVFYLGNRKPVSESHDSGQPQEAGQKFVAPVCSVGSQD